VQRAYYHLPTARYYSHDLRPIQVYCVPVNVPECGLLYEKYVDEDGEQVEIEMVSELPHRKGKYE
jgi:hypothetical protein